MEVEVMVVRVLEVEVLEVMDGRQTHSIIIRR